MAKVKVKRKDDKGTETELEVEEAEVLETDSRVEPVQAPGTKAPEKTLTQSEVNKLMADQRRQHTQELTTLRGEFDAFKQTIADKEKAANDAAQKKVEALRKDLPDNILALLDKLSPTDQLEWLSDPANAITKQTIPGLPEPRKGERPQRSAGVIV